MCSFFSNCLQTFVRFVLDSLVTIYSEKAVLLALSLWCFIHAVKYIILNFNVCLMRNLIVTVYLKLLIYVVCKT